MMTLRVTETMTVRICDDDDDNDDNADAAGMAKMVRVVMVTVVVLGQLHLHCHHEF